MHSFFLDMFDSNQKYKYIVVLCQRNRDQCNGWHSRQAQQLKLSAINIWLGYGVHRTDHGVFVYLKSAPHQPWRVCISETRLALNVNGKQAQPWGPWAIYDICDSCLYLLQKKPFFVILDRRNMVHGHGQDLCSTIIIILFKFVWIFFDQHLIAWE